MRGVRDYYCPPVKRNQAGLCSDSAVDFYLGVFLFDSSLRLAILKQVFMIFINPRRQMQSLIRPWQVPFRSFAVHPIIKKVKLAQCYAMHYAMKRYRIVDV